MGIFLIVIGSIVLVLSLIGFVDSHKCLTNNDELAKLQEALYNMGDDIPHDVLIQLLQKVRYVTAILMVINLLLIGLGITLIM